MRLTQGRTPEEKAPNNIHTLTVSSLLGTKPYPAHSSCESSCQTGKRKFKSAQFTFTSSASLASAVLLKESRKTASRIAGGLGLTMKASSRGMAPKMLARLPILILTTCAARCAQSFCSSSLIYPHRPFSKTCSQCKAPTGSPGFLPFPLCSGQGGWRSEQSSLFNRLFLRGGHGRIGRDCTSNVGDGTVGDVQNESDQQAAKEAREERKKEELGKQKLKLEQIAKGERGLGKVRQHVNPLKSQFQVAASTPVWQDVFKDPSLPLHFDIGCGKGRFALELAAIKPHMNHFGVEIREPLVVRANKWAQDSALGNCHFAYANINVSIKNLLAGYPGKVELVTILMPDPWFKKRHNKRRVVQPEFIEALAGALSSGARLIVGSDVFEVFEDMTFVLGNSTSFTEVQGGREADWPLERRTERQTSCSERGEALYHAVYTRS